MSNVQRSLEAAAAKERTSASRLKLCRLRFLLLAIGALAMVVGLWTGLARLGLPLPAGLPAVAEFHGALMIGGFLGTLISLERAVATGSPWGYAAPAMSGIGALALLAGLPELAAAAFLSASVVLSLVSASIAVRQPALYTVVLTIGAACWAIGTVQWLLGISTAAFVGWWLSFLILTIAAERLELSRLTSPPRSSQVTFAVAVLVLMLGNAHGELANESTPFMAVGLIGCAAWLLHYDIARRTIRQAGQVRFSAVAILIGHLWLGVAGMLLLIIPPSSAALSYDAAIHAIAIGFVLSMIFAHAPIILPAVTGLRVRYSDLSYLPLGLLQSRLRCASRPTCSYGRMCARPAGWSPCSLSPATLRPWSVQAGSERVEALIQVKPVNQGTP